MTPLVGNQGVIVNARHFYSSECTLFDIFVKPLLLPALYLPNAPETVRDNSAQGSQQVDEEVGGWGRCSARSVSRYGHGTDHLVDYLQGSQKKERLDDVNL